MKDRINERGARPDQPTGSAGARGDLDREGRAAARAERPEEGRGEGRGEGREIGREMGRDDGDARHPVGTGIGAVAGGVTAGAAAGAVAGPIGAAVGAAIGAVAGGYAGRGIADMVDPAAEEAYWSQNWKNRSYIDGGYTYDQDYAPAYRYGVDARQRDVRSFDEAEPELALGWNGWRGESRLDWERARPAARDSWQRVHDAVERAAPGDADHDGR